MIGCLATRTAQLTLPRLHKRKKENQNKKKPELKNQKKMTNPASSPFHGREHSRRNGVRIEGKSGVRRKAQWVHKVWHMKRHTWTS